MRVLHVVATDQRRGAEIFASDLIRALDGGGPVQRGVVLRGGHPDRGFTGVPLLDLGRMGRALPGLNVAVSGIRGLSSAIAEWRPDVIQAHGGEALKYAIPAALVSRTPVVYRRIGTAPPWIRTGPRRVVHGALMRRAARVVAVAEAVRREAIDRFRVPAASVETIPNAVDPRRAVPVAGRDATRRSLGVPADAPVLLSIGAIAWEKDPLAHVEIGRRVLAERPDAVHVIVGDGPMAAEVRRLVQERGLADRMRLVGSRSDIGDILAAADVLLVASRSDGMEGMPAIVIEAGLARLPVAGYAVAGVPEVVLDGESGLLAAPGDIDGLVDRALQLLRDPSLRERTGEAGRTRCLRLFDIETVARRYLRVYEEVVAAARRRPEPLEGRRSA